MTSKPTATLLLPQPTPLSYRRHFPLLTICFVGLACAATVWTPLRNFCIDRHDAASVGEWWRLLGGHFVHGSREHLLLNLALFIPLLALREHQLGSRRTLLEVGFLAVCVAGGIRLLHDGWATYQGLSGIVYGLILLSLVSHTSFRSVDGLSVTLALVLVAKTLAEVYFGGWLTSEGELTERLGVRYLPGSHLAGLLGAFWLVTSERCDATFSRRQRRRAYPARWA